MKREILEKIEKLTFQEIRDLALKEGIKDNIVCIGKWAKKNGYIKIQGYKDYSTQIYYTLVKD